MDRHIYKNWVMSHRKTLDAPSVAIVKNTFVVSNRISNHCPETKVL